MIYAEVKYNLIVCCDLCGMEFNIDIEFKHRIKQHNIWHIKAGVQIRNTTTGKPKYIKKSEYVKGGLY